MKKLMTVILALSLTMCLCACVRAEASSLDTDFPVGAGTPEAAAATTEDGTAEAEALHVNLPEDNGMAGIYKWIEMENYGLDTGTRGRFETTEKVKRMARIYIKTREDMI